VIRYKRFIRADNIMNFVKRFGALLYILRIQPPTSITKAWNQAALNHHVAFAQHSLTPTIGILCSTFGGITNLTLAKVLDVFGKPQGYLLYIILATTRLAMMSACKSVEGIRRRTGFYTVGNNSSQCSLSVFVADTSSLRNRSLDSQST